MGDHRVAFFYGTLMAPQVLYRVVYGTTTPNTTQTAALLIRPAILGRYTRHRVKLCDYPAITPSTDLSASVRGTLVQGLSQGDQHRLDIFEGDQYRRVQVKPRLLDKAGNEAEEVGAETYVWIEGEQGLEAGEWDFEEFRREKMSRWVGSKEEYDELDEAVKKESIDSNPTGGRFVNGRLAQQFDGSAAREPEV